MEGCAFANFGNSSGTEGEPSQKREKNEEKNRTRDPSITDQMSVLTNQVHIDTDLTKSATDHSVLRKAIRGT